MSSVASSRLLRAETTAGVDGRRPRSRVPEAGLGRSKPTEPDGAQIRKGQLVIARAVSERRSGVSCDLFALLLLMFPLGLLAGLAPITPRHTVGRRQRSVPPRKTTRKILDLSRHLSQGVAWGGGGVGGQGGGSLLPAPEPTQTGGHSPGGASQLGSNATCPGALGRSV